VAGNRAGAAAKYKTLLGDRAEHLSGSDRTILYHRSIEFEAEEGDSEEAKRLIKRALDSKIALVFESGRASALLAEIRAALEAEDRQLTADNVVREAVDGVKPFDVTRIDYSKGPHDEPIVTRKGIAEVEGLKTTEEGFLVRRQPASCPRSSGRE
jgi:hypothetical protein